MKRWPLITFALAAAAVAIHMLDLAPSLQLSRIDLITARPWTLFTGHLTHWTTSHLAWDVLALLILGSIAEDRSRARYLACLLAAAPVIGIGCLALQPTLHTYRGLSGLDSALFILVTLTPANASISRVNSSSDMPHRPHQRLRFGVLPALAILAFLVKTTCELATGHTLFVTPTPTFTPTPLAHLLGAATALAAALTPVGITPRPMLSFRHRFPDSSIGRAGGC